MYLARKLAYNKKKEHSVWYVECLPLYFLDRHLSLYYRLKCHFFITKTNIVKSNKMSDI